VSVLDGVEFELSRLPADLQRGALAESARAMAMEIDSAGNSATSKSMCQARLQDAMRELRDLAPADEEADQLDELSARRARRIAGGSDPSA
jgi:protein-tyrosine-phosphatase